MIIYITVMPGTVHSPKILQFEVVISLLTSRTAANDYFYKFFENGTQFAKIYYLLQAAK